MLTMLECVQQAWILTRVSLITFATGRGTAKHSEFVSRLFVRREMRAGYTLGVATHF